MKVKISASLSFRSVLLPQLTKTVPKRAIIIK